MRVLIAGILCYISIWVNMESGGGGYSGVEEGASNSLKCTTKVYGYKCTIFSEISH